MASRPPVTQDLQGPQQTVRSIAPRILRSMAVRIGLIIVTVEFVILALIGSFYIQQLATEIDRSAIENVRKPGELLQSGVLRYDVVSNPATMTRLVGETLIDGMVIGRTGNIFHALDPALLGESIYNLEGIDPGWFQGDMSETLVINQTDGQSNFLVSITPLFSHDSSAPFLFAYVKTDMSGQESLKREVLRLVLAGTMACLVLTTVIIYLAFHFTVLSRLRTALGFTRRVSRGDLETRLLPGGSDELADLEKSMNDMVRTLHQRQMDLNETLNRLTASEARFRNFAEAAADWYWEWDGAGRFVEVSDGLAAELAHLSGGILGKTLEESGLTLEFEGEEDGEAIKATISRSQPFRGVTVSWSGSMSSGKRYARLNGIPVFNDLGDRTGYRGTGTDITVERQAIEARERLRAYSAQSQKMEAIGQMAGNIAHDFNNCLSAVKNFAHVALRDANEVDKVKQNISQIVRISDQAADITKQILSFSRTPEKIDEVVCLNRLIKDMEPLFTASLGNATKLDMVVSDLPGLCRIDRNGLAQALLNLVINARDAMQGAGVITLSCQTVEIPETFAGLHGLDAGPYMQVGVADTGEGIAPDLLARIFEPYFSTKKDGQGTGLGLANVDAWTSRMGGFVDVESTPGEGTLFRLNFPCVEGVAETFRLARGTVADETRSHMTVLLVDDQDDVRLGTRLMMEQDGLHVLEAASFEEARTQVLGFVGKIHAVVSDINLGGETGEEVVEMVLELHPDARPVYVTGDVYLASQWQSKRQLTVVTKPFTLAQIMEAIQRI